MWELLREREESRITFRGLILSDEVNDGVFS